MSVVGVRNADSWKSSPPEKGWVGVMGRRNSTALGVDFEADWSPAWENGGEILRAPRRVSKPRAVFAPSDEADEVVTEGVGWLSSLTDRSLDVELDNPLSSPPVANSLSSNIISLVS
ncbi:MAG: hypothetical protein Q9175_000377 [Cornicularia normoerica]